MKRFLAYLVSLWRGSLRGRVILVLSAATFVAFLIWIFRTRSTSEFYTAHVERGDIVQIVSATGTINAVTTVQVGSQVSGNISKLYVDFNSLVKQGQLIAEIDPAILLAQLQQVEADLANAQANVMSLQAQIETQRAEVQSSSADVDKAQAQFNDAQLQHQRARDLAEQGIVPASQRDTAKATADSALATLHSAQAVLAQSKAKLNGSIANVDQAKAQGKQKQASVDLARLNLSHCKIYAPIDGTVIARNVDVGQTVAASLQAPVLFTIAQDLTKMLVYAKTDEADVGRIQAGAMATFRVDSFPRETFSGAVSQIRMNATTIQNVVTYDTIVAFANPQQRLFPGMTAYVGIPVASESNAVKIPNGALRYKPDITEDQRRALYAKYNIPEGARGGRTGAAATGSESGEVHAASRPGGPAAQRGGAPSAGAATNASGASSREDYAIVWKLRPGKSLEPVRVKLGVTDFTFTAMREGALQPGDELVIGEMSKGAKAGPQQSPVGGPRRM